MGYTIAFLNGVREGYLEKRRAEIAASREREIEEVRQRKLA